MMGTNAGPMMSPDIASFQFYGQRGPPIQVMGQPPPPPPPPPPQQQPPPQLTQSMWDQQSAAHRAQEMHHMQHQLQMQQQQMQKGAGLRRPQAAEQAAAYKERQAQSQWMQEQQRQQMLLASRQPQEDEQRRVAEKPLESAKKGNGIQNAKIASANVAASTVPDTKGGGWLDVKLGMEIPAGAGPLLNPKQAGQLKELQEFLKRFKAVDRKASPSELVMEVELKDTRPKSNGSKKTPLLNPEQHRQLQDFRSWFESCRAG